MAAKTLGLEPLATACRARSTGIERVPDVEATAHPHAVPLGLPGASGTADAWSSATECRIPLRLEDEWTLPGFRPAGCDRDPVSCHAAIVEPIAFNSIRMTTI